MKLDKSLIKEFVSITNDSNTSSKENTVYGTIIEYNNELCVRIDGSNTITPVSTTVKIKVGDRVRVTLKDHTATVTGNISDPSASITDANNAAKSATNFLYHDATEGLEIGDKTSGTWVGLRARIKSKAYEIVDAAGTTLSSFGEKIIELGKNATDAIIKLCGSKGVISYGNYNTYTGKVSPDLDGNSGRLVVQSDYVDIASENEVRLRARDYNFIGEPGTVGSQVNGTFGGIDIQPSYLWLGTVDTAGMNYDWDEDEQDYIGYGSQYSLLMFNGPDATLHADGDLDIYAGRRDGDINISSSTGNINLNSSGHVTANNQITSKHADTGFVHTNPNSGVSVGFGVGAGGTNHGVYSRTQNRWLIHGDNTNIYIGGIPYGSNQILWSNDGWWMFASQTATLSQAISAQANGVVLVFSRYVADQTSPQNYNFNTFFIPKHQVNHHNAKGHSFFMIADSAFDCVGGKYLYISDTSIAGFDANQTNGTGTSGINYTNKSFVLRYVIGV